LRNCHARILPDDGARLNLLLGNALLELLALRELLALLDLLALKDLLVLLDLLSLEHLLVLLDPRLPLHQWLLALKLQWLTLRQELLHLRRHRLLELRLRPVPLSIWQQRVLHGILAILGSIRRPIDGPVAASPAVASRSASERRNQEARAGGSGD
jgi:hypothetical protein